MAKRTSGNADGAAAFRKRQKLTHDVPTGEEVSSVDQLRKLLAFDQDLQRARHGLQSFKKLLDDVNGDNDDGKSKLDIIRGYLVAVKPRHVDEDAVFLADIMEMWSMAVQMNNDGVMSSVAVVLSILLHIISNTLDLVPHGMGICQTLIQERQLKSISRNLSCEKGKGFIISPTLRLLREAVCFDGGAFTKRIVRARASTFTALGRNLEIGFSADTQEDARKTSVRTNAVRFLLSCLKYLHSDGRKEILSQRDLFSHLTFMIKSDPPSLILDIIENLRSHILMDDRIPRDVKFKCFNTKTLMRFLSLYTYSSATGDAQDDAVREAAHAFLTLLCTKPGLGVLYPCTGFYPKDTESDGSRSIGAPELGGNSGGVWEAKLADGIPVFNFVLSDFAKKLRPWSSLKHSQLLVSIFRAAPELVADYFLNNRSFTFEPKLSMTWIGYAAFLFDTVIVPLPSSFGDRGRFAKGPPPTSIVLDNVLPLPVNQKVLVRCLSPKSHLTSLFATRILLSSLEKLAEALKMLDEAAARSKPPGVWRETSRKLVDAYCQRIPDMREVVRSYKGIPAENILHRSLAAKLLRKYYQVIPRVALAANFDVSPLFVDALRSLNDVDREGFDESLRAIELENLVSIAGFSPGMRWFSKVDGLSSGLACSPFVALLRVLCDTDKGASFGELRNVLTDVAIENQLVSSTTKLQSILRALDACIGKLATEEMNSVWSFLDNCINRCASSPIKYLEVLETILKEEKLPSSSAPVSLLAIAIIEQLPFFTAAKDKDNLQLAPLATFCSLFLAALSLTEENQDLLPALDQKAREHFSSLSIKMSKFKDRKLLESLGGDEMEVDGPESQGEVLTSQDSPTIDADKLEEMLHVPFEEQEEDATVLVKWPTKSVEDLIEDGLASRVVQLLRSEHINIRKEALTSILKMAAKIKESGYEEKDQVWLLLSEVAESSRTQVDVGPVPSAFTAFTVHALEILRNPLHPLYPKVNSFLTRGPVWTLEKLPLAHDILHGEPSQDDRYYTEITWLLTYLLDSLRTPFDLGVMHRKRWFEKILALGSNPYLRANLRTRLLRLLYRASCIEGGSTTLVTRFGVLSWLDSQRAACDVQEDAALYAALMTRTWDTCDQKRVSRWSRGGVERLVASVTSSNVAQIA